MSTTAAAQAANAPRVIVLDVATIELGLWPQGQAAIIAELRANGYAVELRPSPMRLASELDLALQAVSLESDAVGAVAVSREGAKGIARVRTKRFGLQRLETELSDGTLSRSRLALAVVDRMRLVDIPKLQPGAAPSAPRAIAPVTGVAALWLGAGLVNAGQGVIWPWLSASGSWSLLPPFGVEASLGLSPWSTSVSTGPGEVELRAEQAMAYLAFETWVGRRFSFALGLGGGVSFVHGNAVPAAGFAGFDRVGTVASLGARARGSMRSGNALVSVILEPGVLVPSVELQESSSTLLTLGRPWLASTVGIGWVL